VAIMVRADGRKDPGAAQGESEEQADPGR